MMRQFCKVVSCGRMSKKLNLCDAHYQRFRKGQSLDKPIRKWKARPYNSICKEENCDEPNFAVGLCRKHYLRNWRRKRAAKLGLLLAFIPLSNLQGSDVLADLNKLKVVEDEKCRLKYEEEEEVFDSYERDKGLRQRVIYYRGGRYAPYTAHEFRPNEKSDLEHLVARKEAFRSGLCHQSKEAKIAFITSLPNLVLAQKYVNEVLKSDKDASGYIPPMNRCFFVATVVKVKNLFQLSVDSKEKEALEAAIKGCQSFEMK